MDVSEVWAEHYRRGSTVTSPTSSDADVEMDDSSSIVSLGSEANIGSVLGSQGGYDSDSTTVEDWKSNSGITSKSTQKHTEASKAPAEKGVGLSILFHSRHRWSDTGPMFLHYMRTLVHSNPSLISKISTVDICSDTGIISRRDEPTVFFHGDEVVDLAAYPDYLFHEDKILDFAKLRHRKTSEMDGVNYDYIVTDIENYEQTYQSSSFTDGTTVNNAFLVGRPSNNPMYTSRPRGKAVVVQFFDVGLSPKWKSYPWDQSSDTRHRVRDRAMARKTYAGIQMLTNCFLKTHLGVELADKRVPTLKDWESEKLDFVYDGAGEEIEKPVLVHGFVLDRNERRVRVME